MKLSTLRFRISRRECWAAGVAQRFNGWALLLQLDGVAYLFIIARQSKPLPVTASNLYRGDGAHYQGHIGGPGSCNQPITLALIHWASSISSAARTCRTARIHFSMQRIRPY